jgi:TPR repeat protein
MGGLHDRLAAAVRQRLGMNRIFASKAPANSSVNLTILKECADQGDANAQCQYDLCLHNGDGVSIDLRNAAYYSKLSADQGNADG